MSVLARDPFPIKTILVCIAFDDKTRALATSAVGLARRLDAAIHFVHVLEASNLERLVEGLPLHEYGPAMLREARDLQRESCERAMLGVLAEVPLGIVATSAVITGLPVEAILAEAARTGAGLIVTAFGTAVRQDGKSEGFALAQALMAAASMPVLVTSHERPLDFTKGHFSLMVADDLQDDTRASVGRAFGFALKLEASRVRHVHVHGDHLALLRSAWSRMVAQHRELEAGGTSPEALARLEHDRRAEALAGRRTGLALERSGLVVEPDIRTGDVIEQLAAVALDADPDLIALPRHRAHGSWSPTAGRVTRSVMLQMHRPVLVLPPIG